MTRGTKKRIDFPDLLDEVPPLLRRDAPRLRREMLDDFNRRDEIARAEHLKVALDLRIHSRAIENRVAQAIHLHLRNRKRIANNVLREALDVLKKISSLLWLATRTINDPTPSLRRIQNTAGTV